MESLTTFYNHELPCGIHVVGQPMSGVESAALGILIGAGARDEQPKYFGISHFVEQMLFRGTQQLDARSLSDRLDTLGVSYDASSGLEMSLVSAVLLGDRLNETIDLLVDVVRRPAFPEDDIESVRTLIEQERQQREDRPAQMVMERLRQEFFRGSPLSHDVLGTPETISCIDRNALVAYWDEWYTPKNMAISVAGKFDWEAVVNRLEHETRGWPGGRGRDEIAAPAQHGGRIVIEREAAQENIGFAFAGLPVSAPQYYAIAAAAQALGGGMNSRLFREVRNKRGLAYAVQAQPSSLEQTGMVRVYVGTSAERAHESVEVILDELDKVERDGITEDELGLAKTRLKSQVVMRSESTSSRMVANLRSWWFEGRLRGLDEIRERIDAVTTADVKNILRELEITSRLAIVAIGPRTEEQLFGAASGSR